MDENLHTIRVERDQLRAERDALNDENLRLTEARGEDAEREEHLIAERDAARAEADRLRVEVERWRAYGRLADVIEDGQASNEEQACCPRNDLELGHDETCPRASKDGTE